MNNNLIVIMFIAIVFNGCVTPKGSFEGGSLIPSPEEVKEMLTKTNESDNEILSKSEDKELTSAFLNKKINKVTKIKVNSSEIFLSKKYLYEVDDLIRLSNARIFYRDHANDFFNDEITKKYLTTVKNRGNGYIVYNGNGNEKIFQSLVGRTLNKRGEDYEIFLFNSDLAIIEYDKHGNKISSLIRKGTIEPSLLSIKLGDQDPNVSIHQSIYILFESKMKRIDLNLGSKALDAFEYKRYNMPETKNISEEVSNEKSTVSNAQKIKELFDLYKNGALSKEEYEEEKKKIIHQPKIIKKETSIKEEVKTSINPLELMIIQKFNQQNGTNFTTMQEMQKYIQQNK